MLVSNFYALKVILNTQDWNLNSYILDQSCNKYLNENKTKAGKCLFKSGKSGHFGLWCAYQGEGTLLTWTTGFKCQARLGLLLAEVDPTQETPQLHPKSLSRQPINEEIHSMVNVHQKETERPYKHGLCLLADGSGFLHKERVERSRHCGGDPCEGDDQETHRELLVVVARLLIILRHGLKQGLALGKIHNDESVE